MSLYFPRVTWSGNNHTLDFPLPLDDPFAFEHGEMEVARVRGTGEQDSWTHGIFQRLRGVFRHVPASGTAGQAGYHFPSPGVRAWLAHQRQNKDDFTLYPDKDSGGSHTCRLISASEARDDPNAPLYRIQFEFEDVNGNPFTEY